ncbi:hypothetical protein ACDT10_18710, partial [Mycobacterium intracellulare]|uniref:hypothetical protein n=1 Tax=Mycobacterium intracellulare TaxID=1767 RepID=UPI003556CCBF
MVLGWSDDQLSESVGRLAPRLPDGLSDQMLLAVASVARSIVEESILTGLGVHYARAKKPYCRPKRYWYIVDRRFTWHYVTRAMDMLADAALIDHAVGLWCARGEGCQSVAWATDELVSLLEPLIDVLEPRGIPRQLETVILRDEDKAEIDYTETADTVTMRDHLSVINEKLQQLELRRGGHCVGIPTIRRIFNLSLSRGGRLYCHGNSYQNMRSDERREINFIIDGTAHPAVEIDYSSLHIRMAYSEAGKRLPFGDPYRIRGFPRSLVKLAVNTLFNAPTTHSAINAIAEHLANEWDYTRGDARALAKAVVGAIRRKHRRIKGFFGSDCGARFQRRDSDMAVKVLLKMIDRTGRCPLPMHDSFLVADIDAEVLNQAMIVVAEEYGLRLTLKESRHHHRLPARCGVRRYPPPIPCSLESSFSSTSPRRDLSIPVLPSHSSASYFIMEVTPSDLHRCVSHGWWEKLSSATWAVVTAVFSNGCCTFCPPG